MNGLAQYGVGRGTVAKEIVIGTSDTPVPAAPWDSGGTADAVQLTKWIIDGTNPSEDGYFDTNCELGDICEVASSGALATFNYRGWHVEPYWSNRDRACIQGDNPVSLKKFIQAVGFDKTKGLRALGTSTINVDFIASKMSLDLKSGFN